MLHLRYTYPEMRCRNLVRHLGLRCREGASFSVSQFFPQGDRLHRIFNIVLQGEVKEVQPLLIRANVMWKDCRLINKGKKELMKNMPGDDSNLPPLLFYFRALTYSDILGSWLDGVNFLQFSAAGFSIQFPFQLGFGCFSSDTIALNL